MGRERNLSGRVRLTAASVRVSGTRVARDLDAALRRLNAVDVAQLHAKFAAAGWAVAMALFTPDLIQASLGSVLVWMMTGFTLIGALTSSAGLIVAARTPETDPSRLRVDLRRSLRGLGWELVGLIIMLVGVGLYWLTQTVLSTGPGGDQRIALGWFAYFTSAMLISRLASVLHRRRKEARLAVTIGGTS